MKLIDSFHTQDGKWYVDSSKKYGIDQAHIDRYGKDANELGGANHIYVLAPQGSEVYFETADRNVHAGPFKAGADGESDWENLGLYHSSAYNPDRGEVGPWNVYVDGVLVASGIGLPYGWHVSTFLVVANEDSAPPPTEPPGQMSADEALSRAENYFAQGMQMLVYAREQLQ